MSFKNKNGIKVELVLSRFCVILLKDDIGQMSIKYISYNFWITQIKKMKEKHIIGKTTFIITTTFSITPSTI